MNPVEIQDDLRTLELMLFGGTSLRPDAVFGRDEMGHLDGVKSRATEVRAPESESSGAVTFFVEKYVITESGEMKVEIPS